MVTVLYPTKDATIYEAQPTLNTGIDQILELRKDVTQSDANVSRILMQFNLNEVPDEVISGSNIVSGAKFQLNLEVTEAKEIPLRYDINIHPITGSWDMGIGKQFYDPIVENGVNWNTLNGITTWSNAGGDYLTGTIASQSFEFESANIKTDITNIVNGWITGSYTNDGIIIKRPDSAESGSANYGNINFFSRESHTIFPPRLLVMWDNSDYSPHITQSKQVISDLDINVQTLFRKEEYFEEEQVKFKIRVQPKLQPKTFYEEFTRNDELYLPISSSYAIKDEFTGNEIIPFSDYTLISADSGSSYFNFNMNNLQPDRYYRIVYKVEFSGSINIIDDRKNTFRVGV